MPSIRSLLAALDERQIARRIGIPHDEARIRYPLSRNTVDHFDAFSDAIADYYNYHFTRCVSNGGLYAVLKAMAGHMARLYAATEVSARVNTYWHGLSVDERLAAGDEYLREYGHLLPSELTEGSAARIRADLPKVLIEHPRMMQRLGRAGRG